MQNIHFFEFTPSSKNVKDCKLMIGRATESIPVDSLCRVAVTKVQTGYFFSIRIRSSLGEFESEAVVLDLELETLLEFEDGLALRIKRWLLGKVLEPAFSVQGEADYDEYDDLIRRAS